MDKFIQYVFSINELELLHEPKIDSIDYDFLCKFEPKLVLQKLLNYNKEKLFPIRFIKEDDSDSYQILFYSFETKKSYWIDVFYDLDGSGFYCLKSNLFKDGILNFESFKEIKTIFKKKYQFKKYFKYKKYFSNYLVILNLVSNKLYKIVFMYYQKIKMKKFIFKGILIELNNLNFNDIETYKLEICINKFLFSKFLWKLFYYYKNYIFLVINSEKKNTFIDELINITSEQIKEYLNLHK